MLEVSEKALEYLEKNEEVQKFNSTPVYDEEEAKQGKKMSLVQCLESILGTRDGELKIDEDGSVILDDGERKFILASFFCGFDHDFSADIVLVNKQGNYELKFQFPYDDRYIETCYINGEKAAVNFDRTRGNGELLKEVAKRTQKMDWRGKLHVDVKTTNDGRNESGTNSKDIQRDEIE